MDPAPKGKTLWEMLCERLRAGNGAGIPFANPLDLRVGALVPVSHANGPGFADYDFTLQEIRECSRHLEGGTFTFTDYVLRGVNTKSFDANAALAARIRVYPNAAGAHDALLLRLYDEFAFAEDFLGVLKDNTGRFEVTDDRTGAKESFTRLNGVLDSYQAAVLVVAGTTPDGKASQTSTAKLEYWDYSRELNLGGGTTAAEFLFAEMNSDTGWFQLWRGREFFS
jgi:hypothetical protein